MTNETVKYHHDLDWIAKGKVSGLDPTNANIFFALLHKFKDKGTREIEIGADELKALARWRGPRNLERYSKALEKICDDVISTYIKARDGNSFRMLALFTTFDYSDSTRILKAALSPEFSYILNNLEDNFTKFQLQEFLTLKTKYGKNLFRLLKEYRPKDTDDPYYSPPWREIPLERFKEFMGIPKSYRMTNITEYVIEPAIKDLNQWNLFPNIKWEYKREPGTRGRGGGKVRAVRFDWQGSLFDLDGIENIQASIPFLSDGAPE